MKGLKNMIPNITHTDKQGVRTSDLFSAIFENERKIYLDTEINAAAASQIIAQLEYLDKQSASDIWLYINSPGGSVSAGLAIVDAMRRCRSDIATVCTGVAASMASVISSCGTKGKRYITPFAEIMIHQPLGGISGQASDIERAAVHITNTKSVLMKLLSETTGQTMEQVTADCDRDSYMNAEAAIRYGIADKVLE